MTLEHVALWTENLNGLKDYYCNFFKGNANELYRNLKTGFESYFISFDSGARLEIMQRPGIPANLNDRKTKQHIGLIHLAFGMESKEAVDQMAQKLSSNGFEILRGPRTTGDGYYEFETLDPDGNRIEVIFKN
ncbi:MAG: glyoxalase [Mongoliibacter sp.]|uniref:VOC family protein n=1 Tax=Mongoliibacter sp. TaxID=2022438 RepID=UPI0012F04E99|nr:VOC family protein [Mongoliibacter sp.]TVP46599.1 MAG: glyoxalase [Mongoliibacter sp.]